MRNYLFIMGLSLLAASCGSSYKKEEPQATAVCVSDTFYKASSVYLTKDEKGNPVISWCETDTFGKKAFYLSFFSAATNNFSPVIPVPIEQGVSIHEEGMPKVVIKGDGSIVAVYETSSPTKENEYAGAVRYAQSFDKGKTWTMPHYVHADTSVNGSHSFASVTRLSNGEVGVCWLDAKQDTQNEGRPVRFASTNGTSGFGNEVLIERKACECCRTAISCNETGNASVVFRAIMDSSIRDISLSTSVDNGRTFSRPVSFSNDNWIINGCPHNGPSVINTANATYVTWFSGGKNKGVYYGEVSNRNKATLKRQVSHDGKNIQLCLLPGGERVVVYSEQVREGNSVYSRIIANKVDGDKAFALNITSDKTHAFYPVVSSFGKNYILIAWTENGKVFYTLLDANQITNEVAQPSNQLESKVADNNGITLSNDTDPSCGMHIGSEVEDTAFVNNKVIGFCSQVCKEKYLTAQKHQKL